jgi:hypothetical protein
MFSFANGACRVVTELVSRGFALNQDFFRRHHTVSGECTPLKEFPGLYIEQTDFYSRLLDYFEYATFVWIEQLTHPVSIRDWHYILFPREPLIDIMDHLMVAKDLPTALGYVVEAMNKQRFEPHGFLRDPSGLITITGGDGIVATIGKVKFTHVPDLSTARATKALCGLQKCRDYAFVSRPLSKLAGYPKHSPGSPVPIWDEGSEILHHTSKNLRIALERALKPMVDGQIPLHILQELVATLFSFDSWNHLTGAIKKRSKQLWVPYQISHQIDGTICAEKGFFFYEGLPAGVVAFGDHLLSQENNQLDFECGSHYGGVHLSNVIPSPSHYLDENPYLGTEGIELIQSSQADCESESLDIAAYLLTDPEPEKLLKEYFFVGHDNKQRLIEFNKRVGAKDDDHLFFDDWVFWVIRIDDYTRGFLCAEKVSEVGIHSHCEISSALHKASLVTNNDGAIWLATDWDRKPIYELKGLSEDAAELIERKFISQENWRRFYIR